MKLVEHLYKQVRDGTLPRQAALEMLRELHAGADADPCRLHEFLHENTSDLQGQRYTSRFTGDEFAVRDHKVGGRTIIPAAVFLEMARAAVQLSAGAHRDVQEVLPAQDGVLVLRNIAWLRPAVLDAGRILVHVAVDADDTADAIQFDIHAEAAAGADGAEEAGETYARGEALIAPPQQGEAGLYALDELRALSEPASDAAAHYERFAGFGIEYGADLRALQQLRVGVREGTRFALAELSVPEAGADDAHQYVLHPSIVDGAFQACIGLLQPRPDEVDAGAASGPYVPFALEELAIFGRTPARAFAHVRAADAQGAAALRKMDIDLLDEDGRVWARLRGLACRALQAEQPMQTLLLRREWHDVEPAHDARQERFEPRVLIAEEPVLQQLSGWVLGSDIQCETLAGASQPPSERFGAQTTQLFERIRQWMQSRLERPALVQVVLRRAATEPRGGTLALALAGMLKSARMENPQLRAQVLEVDENVSAQRLWEMLRQEASAPESEVSYEGDRRQVAQVRAMPVDAAPASRLPWKDGGVYLISGGAGGLGLIFAEEILGGVQSARVILTGRSTLDAQRQLSLEKLQRPGAQVEYQQLDVGDEAAVRECVTRIVQRHGRLDGVLHSAGVLRDGFLMNKTTEQLQAVLRPKVAGTVNLDRATQHLPLDCFVLFSSLAGTFGNVGQADYAAANAFMDQYAAQRAERVRRGECHGRTLSIGWPLWQDGGMQADAAAARAAQTAGIHALPRRAGIAAFYEAYASDEANVLVVHGEREALSLTSNATGFAHPAQPAQVVAESAGSVPVPGTELHERSVRYLKKLLSGTLKLPVERIETDAPFEKYGIDSIVALRMVQELEAAFGSLSKTLLFEYRSVEELAAYFREHHSQRLVEQLGDVAARVVAAEARPKRETHSLMNAKPRRRRAQRTGAVAPAAPTRVQDIAVIGLGGRYPQAGDLGEFWENLKAGKDSITEIPAERWDHARYFDARKGQSGKTYSKWGGFLEGVDQFDPLFFNISPREAEIMDPQERLFLQCVYETLEDGGYTRESVRGAQAASRSVGVFVGVMYEEYQLYGAQAQALGEGYALGGSASSIANRVSYFCNFQGPSLAVDTMCSSSLTAIHLACQSLASGECAVAVAGGVNVSIHPNKYLGLAQGQFASSTGRCESFGEGGDGYVPGEGVGAVLLKPLAQAIEDGDRIYALIKATSLNHGGKTNGYTVPNPQAQAQVISQALKAAKLSARRLSYIEAHGTGTSLGDPIEIAGLSKAFGEYTEERQFCAIGSVKSNIGHCESAAGIAGVSKVLLQMKHGMLVPSLHAQTLNPHIDFASSPFVVQRQLQPWPQGDSPRVAGVSSFGAGGANAHVILEEYREPPRAAPDYPAQLPILVVLSGRDAQRLLEQAKRLLAWIEAGALTEEQLADIAYTLQVGREAMEHRFAVAVRSLAQLKGHLQELIAGQAPGADGYRGELKRHEESVAVFAADEDLQRAIEAWIEKGKYSKLLELWVKGLAFDWNRLYGASKPRRISLPTYPFDLQRYWAEAPRRAHAESRLHELLHRNTSDFHTQRFTSTFTGQEFPLRDHIVAGRRILPAAAHLEMARLAVQLSSGLQPGDAAKEVLVLRNLVWLRPTVIEEAPLTVHVSLTTEPHTHAIHFDIHAEAVAAEEQTYVRGQAQLTAGLSATRHPLRELWSRSELRAERDAHYALFAQLGIEYGAGLRSLAQMRVGVHEGTRFVLAELSVPDVVADEAQQYVLHPSIVDGAFQACIGLWQQGAHSEESDAGPYVPFALEELTIFGGTPARVFAYVRGRDADAKQLRKMDIELLDEEGAVWASLRGLSCRALAAPSSQPQPQPQPLLLSRQWSECGIAAAVLPRNERRIVMAPQPLLQALGERAQRSGHTLEGRALPGEGALAMRYGAQAAQLLAQIQQLLPAQHGAALLQVLVTRPSSEARGGTLAMALSAMLKSARQESPHLRTQLIEVDEQATPQWTWEILQQEVRAADEEICYEADRRYVSRLEPLQQRVGDAPAPWKDGGVYLISGGAGGLGQIFAEEILARSASARLILTGRSTDAQLDAEQRRWLHGLRATGRVQYQQLDVGDEAAVRECVTRIVQSHGALDGVLHSAGVLRDGFLMNKTTEQLQAVLRPKVDGIVNLDRATAHLPLELFVAFSSLAGAFGNVGQADYGAANAFMDQYAAQRAERVRRGECHGRTLSIDWPLWQDGGMQAAGAHPMPTRSGVQALYEALALPQPNVIVVYGQPAPLMQALSAGADALPRDFPEAQSPQLGPPQPAPEFAARGSDDLQKRTQRYLKRLLSGALKLPVDRIDTDAPLEKYGVDSISALRMVQELEALFGPLSKTLLFEYRSIEELAGYFCAQHRERLTEQLGESGMHAASADAQPRTETHPKPAAAPRPLRRSRALRTEPVSAAPTHPQDIAVIGISGRFPQAPDLDQFWQNLRAGKDCITEIPKERWDHQQYFDAHKGTTGKAYSKWGGFIDGIDQFDPLFFNISPREAQFMDPHERLFLETTWNLLEAAGYTREMLQATCASQVGVYVGSMYHQYGSSFSGHSAVANRVSYFFGFEGPSISIDTMCSSALIALHTACEDLRSGACQLAIAGGVNLTVHPDKYVYLSEAQLICSQLNGRSFGESDGYLPSEAVGAVLLKPLARALEAKDRILGVIGASAVNHSGRANGYGVPNVAAQARLIARTLEKARLQPSEVDYVEAAATGSPIGDSIEFAALSKVFTPEKFAGGKLCPIGSVKGSLGHAEAASGMQQIAKVLLQMQHRELAPTVTLGPVNSGIDFDATPLRLQRELASWGGARAAPRRALINSFGAGGSNACLVIEEYLGEEPPPTVDSSPQAIVLSAKSPAALRQVQQRLLAFLRGRELSLADLAFTLQVGREHMSNRISFIVRDVDELRGALGRAIEAGVGAGLDADVPTFIATDGGNAAVRSLTAGEIGDEVVALLAAQGSLERIAALWAHGARIDWNLLRRNCTPRLIALPTYPFQNRSYWWNSASAAPAAASFAASEIVGIAVPAAAAAPPGASDTEARVSRLVAHVLALEPEQVTSGIELRELGMDSLGMLKLKRGLAEEFAVVLASRDMLRQRTVQSIAKLITERSLSPAAPEAEPVEPQPAASTAPEIVADTESEFATEALESFKSGALSADSLREMLTEGKIA